MNWAVELEGIEVATNDVIEQRQVVAEVPAGTRIPVASITLGSHSLDSKSRQRACAGRCPRLTGPLLPPLVLWA